MLHPNAVALTVCSIVAAGCTSLQQDTSRDFLDPPADWLVEPADLGLAAEAFELDAGEGSLTGWLVRADGADGRTVLLFHDSRTNASMLHPYIGFLTAAGLNVCAFDYRGFGKSRGEPSLNGMFHDMPVLLEWLRARPEVDPDRLAFYGLGFGSVVALHAATARGTCRALVLEDVPSPTDAIAARIEQRGQMVSTLSVGFATFASLPDGIEPTETAAKVQVPSLWIAGADEPRPELRATLRAYFDAGGDKQLWLLPDTGRAPHSLLTHDGEYQRAVSAFLVSALGGEPARVATSWRALGRARLDGGDDAERTFEIELLRRGTADAAAAPWAVQVCAVDAQGNPTWHRTWLEGDRARVQLELRGEPGVVSAMRLADVEPTEAGSFTRTRTPLSRAGAWYEEHAAVLTAPRDGGDLAAAQRAARVIHERDQVEALPRRLEVQLAPTFAAIGTTLAAAPDAAARAQGLVWLQRALAATPKHPAQHYWPAPNPTWGFHGAEALARARAALRRLQGN
ncbi:MAG: alpha/beta hydrolase [Planctomycetota bacterium]